MQLSFAYNMKYSRSHMQYALIHLVSYTKHPRPRYYLQLEPILFSSSQRAPVRLETRLELVGTE